MWNILINVFSSFKCKWENPVISDISNIFKIIFIKKLLQDITGFLLTCSSFLINIFDHSSHDVDYLMMISNCQTDSIIALLVWRNLVRIIPAYGTKWIKNPLKTHPSIHTAHRWWKMNKVTRKRVVTKLHQTKHDFPHATWPRKKAIWKWTTTEDATRKISYKKSSARTFNITL